MAETAPRTYQPKIIQLSVFLENRVGLLMQLSKQLEDEGVHICALSIIDTADSAIVRLIVDDVAKAQTLFKKRGLNAYETGLVAVEVPIDQGITIPALLGILIRAEINVHYMYSLLIRSQDRPVLAMHVDEHPLAVKVLDAHGITVLGQDDLTWEGPA